MSRRPPDVRGILSNQPLFRALAPEQLDLMQAATVARRAERGDVLFARGDEPVGLWVIAFGRVKLAFTSPQGDEKVLQIFGPGQSFGEAVLFLERPYPVYAQCLEESLLLQVGKDALFEAIRSDPAFARRMLAGLSTRLHELVADVEAYSLRSASERFAIWLLGLVGELEEGEATVELPVTKNVLASRLSLTPETLSRILGSMSGAGLIEVDGRTVRIPDIARLRASL